MVVHTIARESFGLMGNDFFKKIAHVAGIAEILFPICQAFGQKCVERLLGFVR